MEFWYPPRHLVPAANSALFGNAATVCACSAAWQRGACACRSAHCRVTNLSLEFNSANTLSRAQKQDTVFSRRSHPYHHGHRGDAHQFDSFFLLCATKAAHATGERRLCSANPEQRDASIHG
ncbi:unnamed protein product [Ectocarpus sp. 12 AP-2014]